MGAFDLLQTLASAGITVAAEAGRLLVVPASKLTDTMREALRASKPELVQMLTPHAPPPSRERPYRLTKAERDAAHAVAWDDAAIERFALRVGALVLAGFHGDDADDLAERLQLRDVELDDRRCCFECTHLASGQRCRNTSGAGITSPHVGLQGAVMLRRCPGYTSRDGREL
jgi:hypothetical protein